MAAAAPGPPGPPGPPPDPRVRDRPPPPHDWNLRELRVGGAFRDGGNIAIPNLTGAVHPFFQRDKWEATDADYNLLLPSFRLATRLLEVGMPYLASFLPSSKIFGSRQEAYHALHEEIVCPSLIVVRDNIKVSDLQIAARELEEVAKNVKWRINEHMFEERGWTGITRLVDDVTEHFKIVEPDDIIEGDLKAAKAGKTRRQLIIAIMDLFLVPMRSNAPYSEIRLKAQVMAAFTMVHEIGHAVFHQDYRSFNPDHSLKEPYVQKDCLPELGFSFSAWIFSGWQPQWCRNSNERLSNFGSLGWSLCWQPMPTIEGPERTHARDLFQGLVAIQVPFLENLMQQQWWTEGSRAVPPSMLSGALRTRLKPLTDRARQPNLVISLTPNFRVSPITHLYHWKGEYRVRTFSEGRICRRYENAFEYHAAARRDEDNFWDSELEDIQDEADVRGRGTVWQEARNVVHSLIETADDGQLDADLSPIADDENEVLTDIEVRYLPTSDFQPLPLQFIRPEILKDQALELVRRQLAGEDAPLQAQDQGPPRKRLRTKYSEVAWNYNSHDDSERINPIIQELNKTTLTSLSAWTWIQAWDFCVLKGLTKPRLPINIAAQQARLSDDTPEGARLMHRVRFGLLYDLFIANRAAGAPTLPWIFLEMDTARLNWGMAETAQLLTRLRAPVPPTIEERRRALRNEFIRRSGGFRNDLQLRRALHGQPTRWSHGDLQSWCRENGIPYWGTTRALVTRVNRHQRDEADILHGIPGRPKPRAGRADANGVETYCFKAVLERTSLDSLKSALFGIGHFPADTELDVWANENVTLWKGPLSQQSRHVDWTRLVLKARRTAIPKVVEQPTAQARIDRMAVHNRLMNEAAMTDEAGQPNVLALMNNVARRAAALQRIRNAPEMPPEIPVLPEERERPVKTMARLDATRLGLEEEGARQPLRAGGAAAITQAEIAERRQLMATAAEERRRMNMNALEQRLYVQPQPRP